MRLDSSGGSLFRISRLSIFFFPRPHTLNFSKQDVSIPLVIVLGRTRYKSTHTRVVNWPKNTKNKEKAAKVGNISLPIPLKMGN
jgi:hypothetical protein